MVHKKRIMEGHYYDPKHGGCLRRVVRRDDRIYDIYGVYGDDEQPSTGMAWHVTARVFRTTPHLTYILVDFSEKAKAPGSQGQTRYVAVHNRQRRCISWSDGNHWRQLYSNSVLAG